MSRAVGRVVVAMSGGVDSSLAAYLLREQGYDVIGITMQIWPKADPDKVEKHGGCCSLTAVEDARRVAADVGIPYYVVNFQQVFEEKVIDYFCAEYAAGRTPNPCIACNQYVKFGALLQKARELDADFLATGHYARRDEDPATRRHLLRKARDLSKDQTYALYTASQDELGALLFPLGDMTKVEVRAAARRLNLVVADKPESQEICFVDEDYRPFLEARAPGVFAPGDIVDRSGRVLGRHKGLPHYTIGQRRGLGITSPRPLYVLELDTVGNRVVVGEWEKAYSQGLEAADLNFIPFDAPQTPIRVEAKVRYRAEPAPATLHPPEVRTPAPDPNGLAADPAVGPAAGGKVKLVFDTPERAVTPGQAVVLYDGDLVIGGGTITRAISVE